MSNLKVINDIADLKGKKVVVRADLNVPTEGATITDNSRIERFAPTAKLLSDKGAKVIILTHFGRPKGKKSDEFSNKINEIKRNTVEISCDEGKVGYCFSIKADRFCNEYFDTKYEVEEIEKEESRILYVALTRAINKCIWFSKVGNTNYNWNRLMEYAE